MSSLKSYGGVFSSKVYGVLVLNGDFGIVESYDVFCWLFFVLPAVLLVKPLFHLC